MAYKVFRKIEVGRNSTRRREAKRKIILTAKQNLYFNSQLASRRGELASAWDLSQLWLSVPQGSIPHLLFGQVTSKETPCSMVKATLSFTMQTQAQLIGNCYL